MEHEPAAVIRAWLYEHLGDAMERLNQLAEAKTDTEHELALAIQRAIQERDWGGFRGERMSGHEK